MVWPEHPFDESVDDNPAPDDTLRVVHQACPVQLHTLNVSNMTTWPTNRQIWPKSKNSVEYREEVWIVYFRPMAEGLVDLQDRSICLNLKTGEIEIDQNRSIETIMWKSVGDVQWRSGEVRGSNYLENLLLTSGSPSHPAVRANSLFNHNSGENPKNKMLVLNLGKVREESGGRPARSSSCISTCKFKSPYICRHFAQI